MVTTMNKIKANNWTDAQWFNFICGIIRSSNISGSIPEQKPSYKADCLIISDRVIISKTSAK